MTGDSLSALHRLDGRVAIVTGGGSGIGAAICRVLAQAGAEVVAVDRDADGCAKLAADLREEDLAVSTRIVDLRSHAGIGAMVDEIVAVHGRLDILVNSAGVIADSSPLSVGVDELTEVFAVNFTAAVVASQAAAHAMAPHGGGSIVNISTLGVDVPMPSLAAYTASKAALSQFSRSLALEVAPSGVRVNLLSPGWVDTAMTRRHVEGSGSGEHAELVASWQERSPLGSPSDARDQALAVLYLASDAARHVTGATLRVNAGTSMPW